jgi:hypothetical protein
MLNWGLTIYPEFIDLMSLLANVRMVTGRDAGISQLATGCAAVAINIICVRFNTGVTQKPRNFN